LQLYYQAKFCRLFRLYQSGKKIGRFFSEKGRFLKIFLGVVPLGNLNSYASEKQTIVAGLINGLTLLAGTLRVKPYNFPPPP